MTRSTKTLTIAAAAGALFCAPTSAHSAMIYAAQWGVGLYAIDVDAQTVTQIAAVSDAWALSAGADTDTLFLSSHSSDLRAYSLATGVFTPIGAGSLSMNSLAWGSDGLLYSGARANANLHSIDPVTGSATLLGAGTIRGYEGDLAESNSGDLFGLTRDNEIVRVSKADGSTTVISMLSGASAGQGFATTYDGRYWLGSGTNLYLVNLNTGEATFAMNTGVSIYDLASAPGVAFTSAYIPTPGTWALAILGGVLLVVRRRE